ncbi:hypothetical protein B566_EDAN007315 [Ephemera danica]|nr:hypothetical protein B566_EDAN007315 [Ephemera danica]
MQAVTTPVNGRTPANLESIMEYSESQNIELDAAIHVPRLKLPDAERSEKAEHHEKGVAVGRDAVTMLREAIARRGDLLVDVVAVLNDTTGTLIQGASLDKRTAIGLIIATGSNACYLERAERIEKWEGERHGENEVCFTFSFPMRQHAIDCGVLVTWTKSFNCPSAVGRDAVTMLREAIARRGDLLVDVVAVLNDTTGTLIQGASLDKRTAIGLIIATGSNACYLERAERIEKWEGERHGENEAIIDIEWGALGDNGVLDFIKTEFDCELDRTSINPKAFTFEKCISGKYLGELHVCHLASNRAAILVSVCVAGLLSWMDRDDSTIAVDGSMFKFHPRLRSMMETYIELLAPGKKFRFMLTEDGSGKGAGLVAAIAQKLQTRRKQGL